MIRTAVWTLALAVGLGASLAVAAEDPAPPRPREREGRGFRARRNVQSPRRPAPAAREEGEPGRPPPPGDVARPDFERMFEALDANGDGVIDKTEFAERCPRMLARLHRAWQERQAGDRPLMDRRRERVGPGGPPPGTPKDEPFAPLRGPGPQARPRPVRPDAPAAAPDARAGEARARQRPPRDAGPPPARKAPPREPMLDEDEDQPPPRARAPRR